jgi:hypothetical protein
MIALKKAEMTMNTPELRAKKPPRNSDLKNVRSDLKQVSMSFEQKKFLSEVEVRPKTDAKVDEELKK